MCSKLNMRLIVVVVVVLLLETNSPGTCRVSCGSKYNVSCCKLSSWRYLSQLEENLLLISKCLNLGKSINKSLKMSMFHSPYESQSTIRSWVTKCLCCLRKPVLPSISLLISFQLARIREKTIAFSTFLCSWSRVDRFIASCLDKSWKMRSSMSVGRVSNVNSWLYLTAFRWGTDSSFWDAGSSCCRFICSGWLVPAELSKKDVLRFHVISRKTRKNKMRQKVE